MCGMHAAHIRPLSGGGNNRLYRVETANGVYAMKSYPAHHKGRHDRLSAEFEGLEFLHEEGVHCVPKPLARADDARYALYSWIDGEVMGAVDEKDLSGAMEFVAGLKTLTQKEAARRIGPAAEACLSASELKRQVEARYNRLKELCEADPELAEFLENRFAPFLSKVVESVTEGYRSSGWDTDVDIACDQRTLSPSDFGFHNALRRPNGDVAFVDFEYFGWDDPVRLIADFILHPGMNLSANQRAHFAERTISVFAGDHAFGRRLELLYPMVGLRWCMILLNEFLAERWAGRAFAGATDQDAAKRRQLTKAVDLLSRLESEFQTNKGFPYAA